MNEASPVKLYTMVAAALLGLLLVTIGAAYLPLGPFSVAVALLIALIKAGLIVVFFMHIRRGSGVVRLAAFAGFFWLGILFVLAMGDFLTRG